MAVDSLLLFVIAYRLLPSLSPITLQSVLMTGVVLFLLFLGAVIPGLVMKGCFLLMVLIVFTGIAWFVILNTDEKSMIRSYLKAIPIFNA